MKIIKVIISILTVFVVLASSILCLFPISSSAAVVVDGVDYDLNDVPPLEFLNALAVEYPSSEYEVDEVVKIKSDHINETSLVVTYNGEDTVYSGLGVLYYEPYSKKLEFSVDQTLVMYYTANSICVRIYDSEAASYVLGDADEYSITVSFQSTALPSDYVYDEKGNLVLKSSLATGVLTGLATASIPDLANYLIDKGVLTKVVESEVFPDVEFNYLLADLDYKLCQDNVSEFMNLYFEAQSVGTTSSDVVLAKGNLTTNFGLNGRYMIMLNRTLRFIYFQELSTNRIVLKLDTSGYWQYKVYSNFGNAGGYKKLSDYGGDFWFSFKSDDGTDILPSVLIGNKAVSYLDPDKTHYKDSYLDGYKEGHDTGYWKGYQDGSEKSFWGKFLDETYEKMKDAFEPLFNYQIPLINFSIRDIVVFVFSVLVVVIVAKLIGKYL